MTITAEQIAELLGRAEKHNTRSSMAGSATLIWDLAEAVKALSAGPDRMITDSNEAQREIDDLTAQVEALAAERDDLRAKLAAAEARAENLAKEIVSAIKEMEPAASQLARCGFMMRSDAIRITIDALEAALAQQEQPNV